MNYSVEVKAAALEEILDAAKWYEKKQEGLGKRFTENTRNHLKHLEEYPLSYQCKYKENRELLIKNFPYVIVYRVVNNNTVIVLAIASCKQHPSRKRKRK